MLIRFTAFFSRCSENPVFPAYSSSASRASRSIVPLRDSRLVNRASERACVRSLFEVHRIKNERTKRKMAPPCLILVVTASRREVAVKPAVTKSRTAIQFKSTTHRARTFIYLSRDKTTGRRDRSRQVWLPNARFPCLSDCRSIGLSVCLSVGWSVGTSLRPSVHRLFDSLSTRETVTKMQLKLKKYFHNLDRVTALFMVCVRETKRPTGRPAGWPSKHPSKNGLRRCDGQR